MQAGHARVRRWKDIALATWRDAAADNLSLIAAGVAFYAFLALVPLLTAFVLSYGLVANAESVVRHVDALTSVMPESAARIIGGQLQSMVESSGTGLGLAMLLALGIALYGASKAATAIMTALNVVFEVEEARSFVARTLLSLAMSSGAVAVLILSVLAVSAMNLIEALMPDLGGASRLLIEALFYLGAALTVMLLLATIYRFGPNRPGAGWRWITPGSTIATIVWLAATAAFGLYVSNFGAYNATYGSLGAVIVFLTWLYITAYVILMGAELNAILECRADRNDRPPP